MPGYVVNAQTTKKGGFSMEKFWGFKNGYAGANDAAVPKPVPTVGLYLHDDESQVTIYDTCDVATRKIYRIQ
jgi:hypothetical protein